MIQKSLAEISDTQAEATVIATLLAHPHMLVHIDQTLRPGYFYGQENRCFFWAIRELYHRGIENIDSINLSNMINTNSAVAKKIAEYNIPSLQTYIEDSRFYVRNSLEELKEVSNRIISLAFKRELCKACEEVERDCFNDRYDLGQLNDRFNSKVDNLTKQFVIGSDITEFGNKVDSLWNNVVSRRTSGGYGIPSKYPLLSKFFNYVPTNLYVFKARLKEGKSALLMNECINMLQNDISCVYFDTEMDDDYFFTRMIANISGVELDRIESGNYQGDDEEKIYAAINWIKTRKFVHIYMTEPRKDEVYAICKRLTYSMNLQVVFYDYLKCNDGDGNLTSNILGAMTDHLKNKVCGELNLIGIAAAQLNRGFEVADSDKIERYASASIFWGRKTPEQIQDDGLEGGNCMMRVDANRRGMRMDVDERINFIFDGARMRIAEADKQPNKDDNNPFMVDDNYMARNYGVQLAPT